MLFIWWRGLNEKKLRDMFKNGVREFYNVNMYLYVIYNN